MCWWVDRISCAATCWWRTVRGLHTPITIRMLLNYNLDDVNYTHTHTTEKQNKKTSYMNMKGVWKMSRTCFTEWKLITADIMWAESEALWCNLFMFNLFVYYTYFSFIQWFNIIKEYDKLLKTRCTLKANNGTQVFVMYLVSVILQADSISFRIDVNSYLWCHTYLLQLMLPQ